MRGDERFCTACGVALPPAPARTPGANAHTRAAPGFVYLALGWALATAVALGLASYISATLHFSSLLLDLSVTWAIVGGTQVLVLKRVFSRHFLWFPVTLVGGVIGDYFATAMSAGARPPLVYIVIMIGGGMTGLVQCLYLRKRVSGWWWWIAANSAAPALQLFVVVNLPPGLVRDQANALNAAAVGAILGLVLGAVTGLTMAVLRARTKPPLV